MKACATHVFRGVELDFTTEPEGAFSYISTLTESEDAFKGFNHIVLMDGGDGTFDYLYVKLFSDVWSKQTGTAFNCAGSSIYKIYRKMI